MNLSVAKFVVRVLFTAALMTIGVAIYFTSEDTSAQILGTNMITVGWATWMSSGKVKKADPVVPGVPAAPGAPVAHDVENPADPLTDSE
jgi:hypothetical protein